MREAGRVFMGCGTQTRPDFKIPENEGGGFRRGGLIAIPPDHWKVKNPLSESKNLQKIPLKSQNFSGGLRPPDLLFFFPVYFFSEKKT